MPPRTKSNFRWATKVAGLLEADKGIKRWFTNRDSMIERAQRYAESKNEPVHLYIDEGPNMDEFVVITIQRQKKPEDYKP